MKRISLIPVICLVAVGMIFAQAKPFPQAADYPHGYRSTTVTSAQADSIYIYWKSKYLSRDCSGKLRVTSDVSGVSKSEGMGYGLILTAYYGERNLFDSLLAFYMSKRTTGSKGAMGWEATCSGWQDQGSATDGDLDAAYGCIVACKQWGSKYLALADTILKVLAANYVVSCGSGIRAIVPGISGGSAWGGCTCTDISYYTPAYFRLFALADNNSIWTALADSSYKILNTCANATTGLVPDWQAYNGTPGGSCGRAATYGWDACRVPWRMAIDYLWNGNTSAHDWCVKISNWANGIGAANIKSGYSLTGTANGTYHNGSFIGGFAVGSMCNTQNMVNTFSSELMKSNDGDYYNLSLKTMYLLVLTGNLWKPDLTTGVTSSDQTAGIELRPRLAFSGTTLTVTGPKSIRSGMILAPNGRIIATAAKKVSSGVQFNLSAIGRGAYIVNIVTADGGRQVSKFVRP